MTPGPAIADLMRDLAAVSPDVWDPGVHTPALWHDTVTDLGIVPGEQAGPAGAVAAGTPVQRQAVAVVCAVARAQSFLPFRDALHALPRAVVAMATVLAEHVPPRSWVEDPRSREEAARLLLDQLGLRPAGETDAVAADRLAALSTAGLAAAMAELAEEQRRAAELARRLAEKRAREAAARTTYV